MGINFFDTADVYGFGHSEEILNKALGKEINNVVIATKFGVSWDEKGAIGRNCSAGYVVRALESSLRRLKIDCIPLYQIHWPDNETPISETMEVLEKCRKQGKVRYVGCSNFSTNLIREAQKWGQVVSLQIPYNIIKNNIEEKDVFYKNGISILAYDLIAKGLFTGKYDNNTKFNQDDNRSRDVNFQRERFRKILKLVEELRIIGKKYNKTPAQTAIRWVLDTPFIDCGIVGMRDIQQVKENVGALNWKLAQEDRDLIINLSKKVVF